MTEVSSILQLKAYLINCFKINSFVELFRVLLCNSQHGNTSHGVFMDSGLVVLNIFLVQHTSTTDEKKMAVVFLFKFLIFYQMRSTQ